MDESSLWQELRDFLFCLVKYFRGKIFHLFRLFERGKTWLAMRLYWQRGRYSRPFIHSSMALLIVAGITLGPTLIAETFPELNQDRWQEALPAQAVSAMALSEAMETSTLESIKPRAETVEYEVKLGDTISTIAEKFGVSVDTIRWENDLESIKIKPGQKLMILPVTGISHKVKHGETIYSLAKRYQISPQVIVDWPYNSFADDETFALAVGQTLIVPDGIMPKEAPAAPRYYARAPTAGTVTGTGRFAWPASGSISQGYTWYHRAIDISNRSAPDILAADSGTVITVGWPSPWAYGNRVIIDHGNGFATLYAHLSQIYVRAGARISQGQSIGRMGTTGRSTGIHLHFEIRQNGVAVNPLSYLR
jgi:murein DD-endopeptidase MepM/ murein hydrolase activator NlpD